jgi:ABC-type polar amino acid transport system ATPase subunit
MVFQDDNLFPNLSVLDNCLLGLREDLHARREFVVKGASRLGVAELLDRRPWAISQGQRQRVCLIRALARFPRYLLLDEPVSSLDPDTAESVSGFLIDWSLKFGGAVVFASHDWAFAEACATSFWTVAHGSVARHTVFEDALASIRLARTAGGPDGLGGASGNVAKTH